MLARIFVRNNAIALLMALVLLSFFAQAQEDKAAQLNSNTQVSKNGKAIYLQFGNELIDSTSEKPSIEYMFSRTQFNFKRLIRLRENFQQEVREGRGDFGAK